MARNQRTYVNEYKAQADKEARKSDDLIKREFTAEKPLEKCVADMTEIKASDDKLYVSAIFDCYDLAVLGPALDTNMKATLCEQTLDNAYRAYPTIRGDILHSGRCHGNARCESMWARLKEELCFFTRGSIGQTSL